MKLAWSTDVHLNFVDAEPRRQFLEKAARDADAWAVCGDIGESTDIGQFLREMDHFVAKPVYFVLGNHDFYHGSVAPTRVAVAKLAEEAEHLTYLSVKGPIELTSQTAIVGHDGWADGQFGDYWNSQVLLSDHFLIKEISQWNVGHVIDKVNLIKTLDRLAQEAASHFDMVLKEAVERYRHTIAITHIPPFREAAWYQGKVSDDDFLPYFSCKAVGEVMVRVMETNPETDLLVLCGHTHGGGELQVLPNLRVVTGPADYKHPAVQGILEIE